tara:strand:- start:88 stop:918 length:831 start_codon:yes stop_codon:yes gene_type:complete
MSPNEVDFVIYHKGCPDGIASAFAAKHLLGGSAEYYAAAHGDDPPDVSGKNVAILDFSYKRDVIEKMIESANNLVVVDHHKSAEAALKDLPGMIFDMSHSGAYLSWVYFHPEKEVPKFIKHVEDRDLWKWDLDGSEAFCISFDMLDYDLEKISKCLDASVVDEMIHRGRLLLEYKNYNVARIADTAQLRKFCDHNALVVNSSIWMSEIGSDLSRECDVVFIWSWSHKRKVHRVSLRSFYEHVDCSELAKKFGGGGHKKAAGFAYEGENIETIFDNT